MVQHGYMWRGREGAPLLPAVERARSSLTRVAALTSNPGNSHPWPNFSSGEKLIARPISILGEVR
jgi:hypothetical protein